MSAIPQWVCVLISFFTIRTNLPIIIHHIRRQPRELTFTQRRRLGEWVPQHLELLELVLLLLGCTERLLPEITVRLRQALHVLLGWLQLLSSRVGLRIQHLHLSSVSIFVL